jgi:hypothetical protein
MVVYLSAMRAQNVSSLYLGESWLQMLYGIDLPKCES